MELLPFPSRSRPGEDMATAQVQNPALLENVLDDVIRRLPHDAVWSIAEAPPIEVAENDPIGELARLLQARCRRRIDEPPYNAETRRDIEEGRAGIGLTRYENAEAMFNDLRR